MHVKYIDACISIDVRKETVYIHADLARFKRPLLEIRILSCHGRNLNHIMLAKFYKTKHRISSNLSDSKK